MSGKQQGSETMSGVDAMDFVAVCLELIAPGFETPDDFELSRVMRDMYPDPYAIVAIAAEVNAGEQPGRLVQNLKWAYLKKVIRRYHDESKITPEGVMVDIGETARDYVTTYVIPSYTRRNRPETVKAETVPAPAKQDQPGTEISPDDVAEIATPAPIPNRWSEVVARIAPTNGDGPPPWLCDAKLIEEKGGRLYVGVPSQRHADEIRDRHGPDLRRELGSGVVNFEVVRWTKEQTGVSS